MVKEILGVSNMLNTLGIMNMGLGKKKRLAEAVLSVRQTFMHYG